jgi:hypothetical protein
MGVVYKARQISLVAKILARWRQDPELAGIRDNAELANGHPIRRLAP